MDARKLHEHMVCLTVVPGFDRQARSINIDDSIIYDFSLLLDDLYCASAYLSARNTVSTSYIEPCYNETERKYERLEMACAWSKRECSTVPGVWLGAVDWLQLRALRSLRDWSGRWSNTHSRYEYTARNGLVPDCNIIPRPFQRDSPSYSKILSAGEIHKALQRSWQFSNTVHAIVRTHWENRATLPAAE
jgi:hypothetical protein